MGRFVHKSAYSLKECLQSTSNKNEIKKYDILTLCRGYSFIVPKIRPVTESNFELI